MKNTKKIIFIICTIFINSMFIPIHAEENTIIEKSSNNSTVSYADIETKNIVEMNSLEFSAKPLSGEEYRYSTLWSENQYFVFLGYHPETPAWAYASSYTITNSETFTTVYTTTYKGFQFTVNTSYNVGVATTIHADSSRFSRMGVYADIKLSRMKCDIYSYGVYQSTVYHNVGTPLNYYLNVVYK